MDNEAAGQGRTAGRAWQDLRSAARGAAAAAADGAAAQTERRGGHGAAAAEPGEGAAEKPPEASVERAEAGAAGRVETARKAARRQETRTKPGRDRAGVGNEDGEEDEEEGDGEEEEEGDDKDGGGTKNRGVRLMEAALRGRTGDADAAAAAAIHGGLDPTAAAAAAAAAGAAGRAAGMYPDDDLRSMLARPPADRPVGQVDAILIEIIKWLYTQTSVLCCADASQ